MFASSPQNAVRRKRPQALTLICAWLLASALQGCATHAGCGPGGCGADDAKITARVQAQFNQYPALQAPNLVYVQTVDRVVYLRGLVNTPYELELATSVASRVAGVTRVVNLIGLSNSK
jgi:osmotically-inducible protein OsmY